MSVSLRSGNPPSLGLAGGVIIVCWHMLFTQACKSSGLFLVLHKVSSSFIFINKTRHPCPIKTQLLTVKQILQNIKSRIAAICLQYLDLTLINTCSENQDTIGIFRNFLVTFLHDMLEFESVPVSISFCTWRHATGFWLNKGITVSLFWCQKKMSQRTICDW